MLQKDGFFRNRRDEPFRPNPPIAPPPLPASPAPAPSAAPVAADPKSEQRKESRLVVGPDIKMKGVEISDCDTLVVEGRVEATLDSRVLEIAENGVFQGTGKVSGKVRYAKIKVEEGAELAGDLAVLDKAAAVPGAAKRVAGL